MTIMEPSGQVNRRQPKPWYRRYWLIRGRRREDKQARLVVLGVLLALIVPAVVLLASGGPESRVYVPLILRSPPPPDPTAEILDLVNAERQRAGCAPLARQSQLQNAAEGESRHMAEDDVYEHQDLTLVTPRYGYEWSRLGENIFAGPTNAQAAFDGWMASSGHKANILDCRFQDTGIALVIKQPDPGQLTSVYYWTQVFGRPQSASLAAADAAGEGEIVAPDPPPSLPYPPPEGAP